MCCYLHSLSKAFIVLVMLVCCRYSKAQQLQKQHAKDAGIYLADPAILYSKGTYFLYGTIDGGANEGFKAFESDNLRSWKLNKRTPGGWVLHKGDVYGTAGFWAPQVFRYKSAFYMAYVANEQIAIAKSDSPEGPFTQKVKSALPSPVKQIDPFVFIDDDGKKYLYHVQLVKGNRIFVAEMTNDFSGIKTETLRECLSATELWENTAASAWPVTEGPAVIKHGGLYYLFYTANDFRSPDYAVGYAVGPTPYGPWEKFAGNPVISKNTLGINGTGHGDFVKDKDGRLLYVFHTHFSDSTVMPRRTAIVGVGFVADSLGGIDKFVVDKNDFFYPL